MHGETAHTILGRIISPTDGGLTRPAAESILRIAFTDADQSRLQELADKHGEGLLTADETREYEAYVLIGELIALLQAKARQSLRQHPSAA
jgi:hypothetical protein